MATSGSIDFTLTRNQIITEAMELVKALDTGESPTPDEITSASRTLNVMIKAWQAKKRMLWKFEWAQATLTASDEVLGDSDGLNYTCIKKTSSLPAAGVPDSGANYTTYWKQTGSSGSAIASATTAYNCIGNIDLTQDIIGISNAFWRDGTSDTPLEIITKRDYAAIPNKTSTGQPNKLWLDLTIISAPRIHLWPIPDVDVSSDLTEVLHYEGVTLVEDFDAAGNNPDFASRYIEALTFNLAYRLSFKYPVSSKEKMMLKNEADRSFDDLADDNNELDDLDISPDFGR